MPATELVVAVEPGELRVIAGLDPGRWSLEVAPAGVARERVLARDEIDLSPGDLRELELPLDDERAAERGVPPSADE